MRRSVLPVLANVLKAWALVLGTCAFLGAIGFAAGGYRLLSILVFCALLLAGGASWYSPPKRATSTCSPLYLLV